MDAMRKNSNLYGDAVPCVLDVLVKVHPKSGGFVRMRVKSWLIMEAVFILMGIAEHLRPIYLLSTYEIQFLVFLTVQAAVAYVLRTTASIFQD